MNDIVYTKPKKLNKIHVILISLGVLFFGWLFTFGYSALASNQTPSDTISQLNNQINAIDKQLMVNSHSWNDLNSSKVEIEKKMDIANNLNRTLREQEQKLNDEKKSLIVGK